MVEWVAPGLTHEAMMVRTPEDDVFSRDVHMRCERSRFDQGVSVL